MGNDLIIIISSATAVLSSIGAIWSALASSRSANSARESFNLFKLQHQDQIKLEENKKADYLIKAKQEAIYICNTLAAIATYEKCNEKTIKNSKGIDFVNHIDFSLDIGDPKRSSLRKIQQLYLDHYSLFWSDAEGEFSTKAFLENSGVVKADALDKSIKIIELLENI